MNAFLRWLANTSLTARVNSLILGMMGFLALLTLQLQWVEYQAERSLIHAQQQAGEHLQRLDQLYIDWLRVKNVLDRARPTTPNAPASSAPSATVVRPQYQQFTAAVQSAENAFAQNPALVSQLQELASHTQGYLQLATTQPAPDNQDEWLRAGASAIDQSMQQLRSRLTIDSNTTLDQARQQITSARTRTWLLLLLAAGLSLFWGWLIVQSIRTPLRRLFVHAERMAAGDLSEDIPETASRHEFGQMARLIAQLQMTARQTQSAHWVKSHQASLLTLMQSTKSFTELTRQVLDFLCPLLDAAQGGFYIFDPRKQVLRLLGGYALTERKAHHPYFHLGEGLVGQCALERAPLIIQEPPPGYFPIRSSLGQGTPALLYLVPVTAPNRILGVIELAAFAPMSAAQWQLLEAVLPLVGLSIEMLEQRGANAEGELALLTARDDAPREPF
ncbi:GAF domain-containing protein [Halothiobacillus sp. DCM-1]|uniref:GAF domain-containing protein n=1 Tax=Halothiobacillus sp. DCM-1 TaxID=3112558 RepID=UPI00324C7FB7